MNLEQIMATYGIVDYYIWWYGADISDDYLNDEGLLHETIDIRAGKPKDENRVYLVMSGIDGKTCRYRFAIKLTDSGDGRNYYWKRVPIALDEYAGRMIFRRESGFNFYNSQATAKDFVLEEIWGKELNRSVAQFSDYDSVELTFAELKEVIDGHYPDYYKALSSVKGVYMIIDGNSGKYYVGSAYSVDGIWGRWSTYANTYHGGNQELIRLYELFGEKYFEKFKYIILQILPMKTADRDIIDIESKFKARFLTKEFGLNDN